MNEKDPHMQQVKKLEAVSESTYKVKENNPSVFWWVILFLFLIAGALVFAGAVLRWQGKSLTSVLPFNKTSIAESTPTPTPEPVANTPTPSIVATPTAIAPTVSTSVKAVLSIQVLNGSGVSGKANQVKEYLQKKGYQNIATGNASSFDYDQTVVMVKAAKSQMDSIVKADLSGSVTVDPMKNTLSIDSPYDIVIIVGKN